MLLKLDKDFALFYGIMLGDGCLSEYLNRGYKMRIIAITGSSLDDLPFFKEVISPLLKKFRNKESKITHPTYGVYKGFGLKLKPFFILVAKRSDRSLAFSPNLR